MSDTATLTPPADGGTAPKSRSRGKGEPVGDARRYWAVFEARVRGQTCWAWCLGQDDAPGFIEVFYTTPDGLSPAELQQAPAVLGRLVFERDATR